MPTLVLKTFRAIPASENNGNPATVMSVSETPPVAEERVEIASSDDARRAFDAFVEKVRTTTKPAHVFGDLKRGDRAPRGFRSLKLDQYVNV